MAFRRSSVEYKHCFKKKPDVLKTVAVDTKHACT